jgi:gluconolactonase
LTGSEVTGSEVTGTGVMRSEQVLAPGAALEKVATGAVWGEGPVWIPERSVLRWSDIPGNRILQFDPATGETVVHRDNVEFTNGRTLDLEGRVLQWSTARSPSWPTRGTATASTPRTTSW